METYLWIGLGGFLGANARYLVGVWAAEKWGATFPVGTLIVNLTGSFFLSLFLVAAAEHLVPDPRWRLLFAVGFVGAYTTFSTYTYETMQLILAGQWWPGALYLVGSVVLGLLASTLGIVVGRSL